MKKCSVDNCDRPIHAKKLCSYHYKKAFMKNGEPEGAGPLPISEKDWIQACKENNLKSMRIQFRMSDYMIFRHARRYGIAPYIRCMRCGLQPRENFKNQKMRICNTCFYTQPNSDKKEREVDWFLDGGDSLRSMTLLKEIRFAHQVNGIINRYQEASYEVQNQTI